MGKFGVWLVLASVLACCIGDKEPGILLRPPQHSSGSQVSPVFSPSVESVPVGSSSQQQNVYHAKIQNAVHSTASASASAGSHVSDQGSPGGGRNNNQWYNGQGNGFGFDYGGGTETGSASSVSHAGASSGGYYEQPPQQPPHQSNTPSITTDGYSPAASGGPQGPSYTYYYQHYPSSSSGGQGWSGGDDGGGIFSGMELPGLGGGSNVLAGFGGFKIGKIVLALAKGILAVKPFLILGLLLLIAIPVLLLLLPIPIITITGQPATLRSGKASPITSYLTELTGKVVNSEECLERIICKLPQPPEKYQKKAKLIWDEYGTKVVTSSRVTRGLNAYFESSSQKNRNLKCDQRFKCSNKYI